MLKIEMPGSYVEDVLMAAGQPTKMVCTSDDPAAWDLIFPIGKEVEVMAALRQHAYDIVSRVGDNLRLKTILFHLAYDLMSHLAGRSASFVSTNILNLKDPRAHMDQKGALAWSGYDVSLIAVGLVREEHEWFIERALGLAEYYNAGARYLRIETLSISSSLSRAVSATTPVLPERKLPPPLGAPLRGRE